MSDLKPCPFCGSDAERSDFGWAGCKTTGCPVEGLSSYVSPEAWNNRATKELTAMTAHAEKAEERIMHLNADVSALQMTVADYKAQLCTPNQCAIRERLEKAEAANTELNNALMAEALRAEKAEAIAGKAMHDYETAVQELAKMTTLRNDAESAGFLWQKLLAVWNKKEGKQ